MGQLIDHISSILSGGKGTLSSKYKKRSNSANPQQLHLSPKKKSNLNDANRRKSLQPAQEHKSSDVIDDEWDPFSDENNGDNDSIFSDNFSDLHIASVNNINVKDVSSKNNEKN